MQNISNRGIANNVKTVALLGLLGGGMVAIGSALGGSGGATIAFVLALVTVGGSYWFSDTLAVKAAGAKPVEAGQLAWLQNDLAELSQRAGIATPRLYISPSLQPNAFATGRNERKAVVAVTAGLLEVLDRREVRGVVAHELGHIKHKDILIGSVAAAIATGISYVANMAMWAGAFGGGDDEDRPNPIAILLVSLLAPVAAMIIQATISRAREYEADRAGGEISGDPTALADALGKIEAYVKRVPMTVNPAQATAFIINPFTGRQVRFASLFQTHPPTEERVARLHEMSGSDHLTTAAMA
jgi:heat shock protein HtpX